MLARYKTMFVRSSQCWPVTRQYLSGVVNVGPLQDNICQEWSMLARYKTMLSGVVNVGPLQDNVSGVRSGQCWLVTRQCLSGVVNVGPLQEQCLSGVVNVGPLQDNACQEWSMLVRYKTMFVRSDQC